MNAWLTMGSLPTSRESKLLEGASSNLAHASCTFDSAFSKPCSPGLSVRLRETTHHRWTDDAELKARARGAESVDIASTTSPARQRVQRGGPAIPKRLIFLALGMMIAFAVAPRAIRFWAWVFG